VRKSNLWTVWHREFPGGVQFVFGVTKFYEIHLLLFETFLIRKILVSIFWVKYGGPRYVN
jgi:hypothetical protein